MVDWNNPTNFQFEALYEALLFAYPSPADLNVLLTLRLNKNYSRIAPVGVSYQNALLEVLRTAQADGWCGDLVRQARAHKPKSPKLVSLERGVGLSEADVPANLGRRLEDIVRTDGNYGDLIPWLQNLERIAWRTCRVEYPVNTAQGTGWLVGTDLVLTNWHVIDRALPPGPWQPAEFVFRFDYAVTSGGTKPGTEVRLAPGWCVDCSPPSRSELGTGNEEPTDDTLDFALLRLERPLGGDATPSGQPRGWMALKKGLPVPGNGDIVFVIQHPDGLPVKLAVGDVTGLAGQGLRIQHTANTRPGASGALVVNASLVPIALHHAGDLLYHRGKLGQPEQNQAVPLDRIVSRLGDKGHLNV